MTIPESRTIGKLRRNKGTVLVLSYYITYKLSVTASNHQGRPGGQLIP